MMNCAARLGYTEEQLQEMLTPEQMKKFNNWMAGQTRAWCDCHGPITYPHDLARWLRGLPVID